MQCLAELMCMLRCNYYQSLSYTDIACIRKVALEFLENVLNKHSKKNNQSPLHLRFSKIYLGLGAFEYTQKSHNFFFFTDNIKFCVSGMLLKATNQANIHYSKANSFGYTHLCSKLCAVCLVPTQIVLYRKRFELKDANIFCVQIQNI